MGSKKMGKKQFENKNANNKKDIREKGKDDRKNKALGIDKHNDFKNKLKLPKLQGIKTNIIQNIQNKNSNSARNELLENLKKKMNKANNADTLEIGQLQSQAQETNILYTQEDDGFNTFNQKDE